MRPKFKKSSRTLILSALFCFSIVLTFVPEKKYGAAQMTVISALAPVEGAVFYCSSIVSHFAADTVGSLGAGRRNRALAQQVNALENRVIRQHNVILAQRETINALTNAGKKTASSAPLEAAAIVAQVPGSIISVGSSAWRRTLIVDAGSAKGVEVDMPVVWNDAVVGRIVKVGRYASAVQPVNDPDFRIWAVDIRSREQGIVSGKGSSLCSMEYVPLDADVTKNDWLVSTGFEGIFPGGFVVGQVSDAAPDGGLIFKEISVRPAVDMRKLENVVIVKVHKPLAEFPHLK